MYINMKKIGKNEEGRKLGEKGWKGGRVKEKKRKQTVKKQLIGGHVG